MHLSKGGASLIATMAALTGLASAGTASAATVHGSAAKDDGFASNVHALTGRQAQALLAAAKKGPAAERAALRATALVRSAGAATPDAVGSKSYSNHCTGSWLVFGGHGSPDAYAATNESCTKFQSLLTVAFLSRDRFFGWSSVASAQHSTTHGEFENAEAVWRCKGVGTYTYRNLFADATNTGGHDGSIQSRFAC
jgi:hypothetical protein